jgi:hypothetical protein
MRVVASTFEVKGLLNGHPRQRLGDKFGDVAEEMAGARARGQALTSAVWSIPAIVGGCEKAER